jgi:arylsulfatase A-like enzyme
MSGTAPNDSRPVAGGLLVAGVFGGAIAGAGTGAIDAVWSWSELSQFLPGFGGKLRLLLYLASAYALVGALLGPIVLATARVYWRWTRLGDVVRFGLREHRAARKRDPRDALAGLSLVLAGVPITAAVLGATYAVAVRDLARRQHRELAIAVAMLAALAALAAAVMLSVLAGRAVESGLRRLARNPRLLRALSSPLAPVVAAGALAAVAGAVALFLTADTLKLVRLRPYGTAVCAAVLVWPSLRLGSRIAARLRNGHRAIAAGGAAANVLVVAVVALLAGASQSVVKAADHYSGLGGAFKRALRSLVDFDGDGYSPILGGGDCDDSDPTVHPGAVEIPDDGIDQNCIGGDATVARNPDDVAFAPVPDTLPHNPNILLITIDTLRADHVGAYGYERPTTPAIDALGAGGAVFENAWAHAPSTRYSVPAILTGRYPLAVDYDMSVWWPALDPRATTIAETLAGLDYHTGAILNYRYFDPQRRMDQGFDEYDNENARLHSGRDPATTKGSSSREQTDKAIAFLERNAHRKFFLWVHYYDPHYTYERHPGTESFGDADIDVYDHEIRFTDDHIGRLIAELGQRGLYDKTVIAVTGDHGEGFGEHGVDKHGYHLYAAQTKVPLIIRAPGSQPVRVAMPAGHIDLLPTLTNLAGGRASTEMQGRSLVDVIAGNAPDRDRWVFQQLSYENNNEMRAGANQRCHIIYNVSPQNTWELYRIDTDPNETRDAIDDPGPCSGARAELERWYDHSEIPPRAAEALLPGRPDIAAPLDVEFGSAARLLAVDIPDAPVRPGESVDVTFTWEARGSLPDDWKVFLHFEAPGGDRFIGDHAPERPFAWWRAGQFIRYTHTVTVPRAARRGDYVMWMGLFKGNDRQPASAPDARVRVRDDRASVGVVRVQR